MNVTKTQNGVVSATLPVVLTEEDLRQAEQMHGPRTQEWLSALASAAIARRLEVQRQIDAREPGGPSP